MPLGHMLTQKIAYQIASGLAYLHKKSIIFCDLKSDNILVWSLSVKEHVNIKLSDYGISRQSFHEGALGVEGTPGYQAPEIRPRIVYDEKVPACPAVIPKASCGEQGPSPVRSQRDSPGTLASPDPACVLLSPVFSEGDFGSDQKVLGHMVCLLVLTYP